MDDSFEGMSKKDLIVALRKSTQAVVGLQELLTDSKALLKNIEEQFAKELDACELEVAGLRGRIRTLEMKLRVQAMATTSWTDAYDGLSNAMSLQELRIQQLTAPSSEERVAALKYTCIDCSSPMYKCTCGKMRCSGQCSLSKIDHEGCPEP